MQRYRIILRDYLNLGRDRDVTFTALGAAEEFINSLSREGTVCVYVVTGYTDSPYRVLTSVERYVVWNDRDRYAALEGNRQAAGLKAHFICGSIRNQTPLRSRDPRSFDKGNSNAFSI